MEANRIVRKRVTVIHPARKIAEKQERFGSINFIYPHCGCKTVTNGGRPLIKDIDKSLIKSASSKNNWRNDIDTMIDQSYTELSDILEDLISDDILEFNDGENIPVDEDDDSTDSDEDDGGADEDEAEITPGQFKPGSFVVLKRDVIQYIDPVIWKRDGRVLLQKYIPFEINDEVLHKETPLYAGWNTEVVHLYDPVKVLQMEPFGELDVVKVDEDLTESESVPGVE